MRSFSVLSQLRPAGGVREQARTGDVPGVRDVASIDHIRHVAWARNSNVEQFKFQMSIF